MYTNLWLIPDILHPKLIHNHLIGHYFKGIPKGDYNILMTFILAQICTRATISIESTLEIQKTHGFKVHKSEYDEFVRLFLDATIEIGENPNYIANVFKCDLSPLILMKNRDDVIRQIKKRFKIVQLMLEIHDICPIVKQNVDDALACLERTSSVNQL
jgi:hypothetical protein